MIGSMPVGFCCSKCELYDEAHTCLKMKTDWREKGGSKIVPISTKIENGVLKVVVDQRGKKIPIVIDLRKHFGSD